MKILQFRLISVGFSRLAYFLVLGVGAFSCTTMPATPSGRQGLIQRLSESSHQAFRESESAKIAHRRKIAGGAVDADTDGISEDTLQRFRDVSLQWPLTQVKVTSSFGKRKRGFHEGIDLKAWTGTPVFASQEGVVLYSGRRIHGYGRMIIIRHNKELSTVYAHNSKLLVRQGQQVKQGQKIAISGRSGHASGPHLHFEVRNGTTVIDPTRVLPEVATSVALLQQSVQANERRRRHLASSESEISR